LDATTSSPAPTQAQQTSVVTTDYSHQLIVRGFDELKFRLLFRAMKSGVKNTTILALGELLDRADEAIWEVVGIMQAKIFVKDFAAILGRGRSCMFAVNRALVDAGLLNRWPSRDGHRPAIYQIIMPGEKVDETRAQLAWDAADNQSKISDARAELARADVTPDPTAARAQLARADVDRPSEISDARAELARADVTADATAARAQLARAEPEEQSKNSDARAELARAEEPAARATLDFAGTPIALSSSSTSAEEEGRTKTAEAAIVDAMLKALGISNPTRGQLAALATTTPRLILAADLETAHKKGNRVPLLVSMIREPERVSDRSIAQADAELARRRKSGEAGDESAWDEAHRANVTRLRSIDREQVRTLVEQVKGRIPIAQADKHKRWATNWTNLERCPDLAAEVVAELEQQGGVAHV
jgi:ribosomal protein L29